MRLTRTVWSVALLWWIAAPSLMGQDFLKQLEEKILKRQEAAKAGGGEPAAKDPNAPPSEDELPAPTKKVAPPRPTPPMILNPPSLSDEALPSPDESQPRTVPSAPTRTPGSATTKKAPPPIPNNPMRANANAARPVGGGGYLGMTVESIPGGGFGLTVASVTPDSPAWKAGFRAGDRLIGVDGNAVSSVDAFAEQLAQYSPGTPIKFLVERRGRNASLTAVLMDRSIANRIHGNVPGSEIPLTPGSPANIPGQAYFGINVADLSEAFRRQFAIPAYRGASVTEVIESSPAEVAGLKPGDCIVTFQGQEVRNAEDVLQSILSATPGQIVTLSFYRGSILQQSTAVLVRADGVPLTEEGSNGITADMLTPEYVSGLQTELNRVLNELQETQSKMQQLEARLKQLESRR